jgi:hypothetical protein
MALKVIENAIAFYKQEFGEKAKSLKPKA